MLTEAPSFATEILLLEKSPDQVLVIKEATSDRNLSVVPECPDVLCFLRQEGRFANSPRPDLILLDLDLSLTEDCKTLTEIKKDPAFRRIPVIVLAASEAAEDVFQAYDLHANAYIQKPADRDELVRVVRQIMHFWLALVRLPQ